MNFATYIGNNKLSVVTMATKRKTSLFSTNFGLKKPHSKRTVFYFKKCSYID